MLYDTHCHPYLAEKKSQDKILNNFSQTWDFLNCIWIDIESSKKSIIIANNNNFIYATIWIHPSYTKNYIGQSCISTHTEKKVGVNLCVHPIIHKLENFYLKNQKKVVAIWECGLDYFYLWEKSWNKDIILSDDEDKTIQKDFFIAQIKLAKKYNLPLIIHNRDAASDIFEILIQEDFKNFIMHCFCEDLEYALKCIEFAPECKISFSWIVTFNSAKDIQETATKIPLKNIIIETDSPFLTPTPLRGKEENEPIFVQYVLDKIIELREESADEIKKTIFENSLEMFSINDSPSS